MPKSLILALLHRVAPIDLPEILVEVEKGIFKSDLSKLQAEIQETRYSSGQYKCPFCHDDHIVKNGKAKKIYVFKMKRKKNERKKKGHRQPFTKVEITKINA